MSSNDEQFWEWTNFSSYIKFLIIFTFSVGLSTYLLVGNSLYVELIGFIALMTESTLAIPQLVRNFRKKSTKGMSVVMVIMWLSGDIFKTLYSLVREAPSQFVVCGSVQIVVDIAILTQVLWYHRPRVGYWRLPKSG